ncbi:MAG: glycosyltransferase family 2 protein [Planctomycetota bacterium]|nr:glycosyltransferase family 2 protein [Planctomycetota bacterium]
MAGLSPKTRFASSKKIGVLVVAYNAQATLRDVLLRIPPEVSNKISEIFVFDDASQDETYKIGVECQQELHEGKLSIFRNPVNLMYGGNQQKGYKYAISRGLDIVVLLHGDGQYAPEVMQELLTPLENNQADMVMGSRMMVKGAALRGNMPTYKYVGNRILTTIENRLIGTNLSEFHSGYRAYSVSALRSISLEALTTNWHFDTQIILEFLKRGYRINEVPIPTYYGDEICYVNGIPYAWNCIRETMHYAYAHRWRPHAALPAAPRPQE